MKQVIFIGALFILVSCTILDPNEPGNLVPKTVDENGSLPALAINGTNLHLKTFGNPANPVIILLHGGPGGDHRYLLRLKSLQDTYFLVFYDQRGGGLSRRHNKYEVSISLLVRDLDSIIEHFSPGVTVTLVGHSWGGQLATAYVTKYPAKVQKLILLDPGPFTSKTMDMMNGLSGVDLTASVTNDMLWSQDFISPADHIKLDYSIGLILLSDLYSKAGYNYSKTDRAGMWRYGVVAQSAVMSEAVNANGDLDFDLRQGLSYANKVLFIWAGNNTIMDADYRRAQMAYYSNKQFIMIPGVGHDFPWVSHDRVDAEIRAYLAKPSIY